MIALFAFMMAVNVLMFWTQTGVNAIAEEEAVTGPNFFSYEDSALYQYDDDGNYTIVQDVASRLPESDSGAILPDSDNFFTDIFNTFKNWFLQTTGLRYLVDLVTAVPNLLANLGLPREMAYGLGVLWHAISFFVFIAFLKG